jgi:murein L,D-transpeptidase YafK
MKILAIISIILLGCFAYANWPTQQLPEGRIDRIVVDKSDRELHVLSNETVLKTYSIALGHDPQGHKMKQGDGRTPKGIYSIDSKNPKSGYHLNLGISYPDQKDKEAALALGHDPGGDIKIHGLRNGVGFMGRWHRLFDWTLGCIAVTNDEMDELYERVEIGTSIEIRE